MKTPLSADQVRKRIEATRLTPDITKGQLLDFAKRSIQQGYAGICVLPQFVGWVSDLLLSRGARTDLVTVANFPAGGHIWSPVERCIRDVINDGAAHIDVVAPLQLVRTGDWSAVEEFLRDVVATAQQHAGQGNHSRPELKLIMESAALTVEEIEHLGTIAVGSGFHWLKTSTGMHPSGGATLGAVAQLRKLAPASVKIKASGGIRSLADLSAMVSAGADRIGTSSEEEILKQSREA